MTLTTTSSPGDFARLAKSIAQGARAGTALEAAERARSSERVLSTLKAAIGAGSLGDPEWAGSISSYHGLARAFIEGIRPQSLFYSFAALSVPSPMRARLVASAMITVDDNHAEREWMPLARGAMDTAALAPVYAGSIIVASDELIDSTDAESFAILRRELEKGATAAVDRRFWSIASAGITATAANINPPLDMRELLNVVNVTGGGAGQMLIVMDTTTANVAATVATNGQRIFPDMGPFGGQILGIPAMVTDNVPTGTLALMNAAGFAVNSGSVATDIARSASLQMRYDPTQAAAQTVSLFQTNAVALRVMARFVASRVKSNAIAILSGCLLDGRSSNGKERRGLRGSDGDIRRVFGRSQDRTAIEERNLSSFGNAVQF